MSQFHMSHVFVDAIVLVFIKIVKNVNTVKNCKIISKLLKTLKALSHPNADLVGDLKGWEPGSAHSNIHPIAPPFPSEP